MVGVGEVEGGRAALEPGQEGPVGEGQRREFEELRDGAAGRQVDGARAGGRRPAQVEGRGTRGDAHQPEVRALVAAGPDRRRRRVVAVGQRHEAVGFAEEGDGGELEGRPRGQTPTSLLKPDPARSR